LKPVSGTPRYCAKCGAAILEGAAFCAKCGAPVTLAASPPAASSHGGEWHEQKEKHEKHEKREKSEKGEKGEKREAGDVSGILAGGLILIWLGITFYYAQSGVIGWDVWWAYFVLGLGLVLVAQGLVRYAQGRRSYLGSIAGGVIIALIGYVFIVGVSANFWPLILVVIGVLVIVTGISGRRSSPTP